MYWSQKKCQRRRLIERFGVDPAKIDYLLPVSNRMEQVRIYHETLLEQNEELTDAPDIPDIDEITWSDLEMDQVYERINNTKCYAGEQVLYHTLHQISGRECKTDLEKKFEEHMTFFTDNEEERVEIEEHLAKIGKKSADYYLPAFLKNVEFCRSGFVWIYPILQVLFIVCLAGCLWKGSVFLIALITIAAVNMIIYLLTKQKYEVVYESLFGLKQLVSFCRWMFSDKERKMLFADSKVEDAIRSLNRVSGRILHIQARKSLTMSGDLMGLLYDYLMGITLCDVVTFYHVLRIVHKKQNEVMRLYRFVGEVDAQIAIASFRQSEQIWCKPQFIKNHEIVAKAIVHPLLEDAVDNDLILKNRAMITGANASGKSTFMKAIAVNVILAQTIHTCLANDFHLPRLSVMTCMSLRDDIISGESYYVRETRYLKRMLDQIENKIPTFCVIDEILKGTNTNERLAASAAILDYLACFDCFVLVATHDRELILNRQKPYDNYYFESSVTGQDICFDYRIHKGIVGDSNAIALLELLGYPQIIIDTARKNWMVRKG